MTNRSFQLFICFVFISVYAPLSVFGISDPHGYCGFLNASGAKGALNSTPDAQTRMNTGENAKVGFYNSSVRLRLTHNDYQETDKANYTVLASTAGRLVSRDTDPRWLQMGAGARADHTQAAQGSCLRCEGGCCMKWNETISAYDAAALVSLLSEALHVRPPRLSFTGRQVWRGRYRPSTKTILLHKSKTLIWIVAHEFAHYLDHIETGRNIAMQSNDKEWHSQGFYYKLRKVISTMDMPDYPWRSEYKQLARWAAKDGLRGDL